MKVHHLSFALLPLVLAACCQIPPAAPPDKSHPGLEIRSLTDEQLKQLGAGRDDFVSTVTSDGTTILYRAPGTEFRFVKEDPPEDLKTTNRVMILVTPKASPACFYYSDGMGNKVWRPSPPCPIIH